MEERLDKDKESYLDGLLESAMQEPPYETDRRRKATARAKSGKNKVPSKDISIDSLEEEFNLDDLDDSFLDDIDLDDMLETSDESSDVDKEGGSDNEEFSAEEEEAENAIEVPSSEEVDSRETESAGQTEVNGNEDVVSTEEVSSEEVSAEGGSGEFEIATELGVEIGGDDEEISFDEAGMVVEEEPLPVINPLDDMGTPEVLSDEEIKSKIHSKKGKPVSKNNSEKKGLFTVLFHKLFANIPLTEEELAAIPTPEQEAAAKKEKADEAAKKKEEKKAAAEANKKKKAEEAKKKAADNKAKKAAKDAAKKAAKKEAELKRLRAEALEQPEGKINKAGAIIIFLFFIVAGAVVIVGTNIFSYDISIADATYKFGNRKYTEAYEGIRGLEIKEKDMELHDKIYTVMFVNKQLNSYNNFFAMGDYPSALDSLVKGLSRYDKYIALARQLGINTDLDYVRGQIMSELQSTYGISEREALELMGMVDRQEYSERIYSIVSKLDTKAIEAGKEKKELVP